MLSPITNAVIGIVFLGLAVGSTFLMYHLWGYPFDKETLRSSAPSRWMLAHRLMGWAFVLLYLYFMSQMLPRLWSYQVEFPARTVVHLSLGLAIGAMLLVKIVIVRYFKHMEGVLAPALGTGLLVSTVTLIGLSAPFAFTNTSLENGGGVVADESRLLAVAEGLDSAGLAEQTEREGYASMAGLESGRQTLFSRCVECHDLRTVLARPRTPSAWRSTVARMADRAALVSPIDETEQWSVTAYLISITPNLQRSTAGQREEELTEQASREAVREVIERDSQPTEAVDDPVQAQALVEQRCAQCHSLALLDIAPPESREQAQELVERMVANGLVVDADEVGMMVRYLANQ